MVNSVQAQAKPFGKIVINWDPAYGSGLVVNQFRDHNFAHQLSGDYSGGYVVDIGPFTKSTVVYSYQVATIVDGKEVGGSFLMM